MKSRQRAATLALCAVLSAAASGAARAHGEADEPAHARFDARKVEPTAFGQQGNPSKVTRTIKVDMRDTMRYTPAALTVKRGETVRFIVHNSGSLLHEMVLGTPQALAEHAELMKKFPEMEHADPHLAHVRPGRSGEIVWQFTRAGRFQFACLQPGHFEAGMVGTVVVN